MDLNSFEVVIGPWIYLSGPAAFTAAVLIVGLVVIEIGTLITRPFHTWLCRKRLVSVYVCAHTLKDQHAAPTRERGAR